MKRMKATVDTAIPHQPGNRVKVRERSFEGHCHCNVLRNIPLNISKVLIKLKCRFPNSTQEIWNTII